MNIQNLNPRFLRLIKLNSHAVFILLIVLLSIPAFKDTIRSGFFSMHDDLQAMRQLTIDQCFRDGQIPCRWSKDLGFEYGYPIFNYYPPLPYYIGEIFHLGGLQIIDAVKALVVLNFILCGIGMYLLAQEFWGKWGGLISGVFYIYAPYHSVDIYVRGAFDEAFALIWFPFILWSIYKLIQTRRRVYIVLTAVFVAFLMLSHNLMLMIFTPLAIAWTLYWLWMTKKIQNLPGLIISALWAFGLAAFFTLPVLFEQKYVQVNTLVTGYYDFRGHFATIKQLFFSNFWGYGGSVFGPNDGLSFQVGYLHSIFAVLSLIVALMLFRKNRKLSWMIILIFIASLFYTFMTHQKSLPIWLMISPLKFLQFPWRFLGLTIFGCSFLAGSSIFLINLIKSRFKIALIGAIFILVFILYLGYFHWDRYFPTVTDASKFSGQLWQEQIGAAIYDYLPIWVPYPPTQPPSSSANMISGQATVKTIVKQSNKQIFQVNASQPGTFQINSFYFPDWSYYVNDKKVSVNPYQDKQFGRPRFNLMKGDFVIKAVLTNTPVELIGNLISALAWLILIGIGLLNLMRRFSLKL